MNFHTKFLEISVGHWVLALSIWILCLFCSTSEAALSVSKNIAINLLNIEDVSDIAISSVFITIAYVVQYCLVGGLFELTNPKGVNSSKLTQAEIDRRKKQVSREINLGIKSLALTVILTVVWMAYGDKHTYFYGYFQNHEYNWKWFLTSFVVYVFWFDTWFYWSHRWLHDFDFLWRNIHLVHHQFKEPSAFAQFAVHPFESALQGPVGHYLATFFFPIHPIALSLFGFAGSVFALAAHDGRRGDLNSHYYHHSKGRGRLCYFNLGYVTPFWDQICGTRWSEDHPLWVEWKQKRGKSLFDTLDGSKIGEHNDIYGAYVGKQP